MKCRARKRKTFHGEKPHLVLSHRQDLCCWFHLVKKSLPPSKSGKSLKDQPFYTPPPRKAEAPRPREPLPPKSETTPALKRPTPQPLGPRIVTEQVGVMLETDGWDDFRLLDMGDGQKLESYGPVTVVRPEPQAMGPRRRAAHEWEAATAVFSGDVEEEGPGRWKHPTTMAESWEMRLDEARYLGRLTSFRHVGIFPEQIVHWRWAVDRIQHAKVNGPFKVLNLFGYTGLAALLTGAAGAEVTHVDASKKAIAWARENQAISGLDSAKIRWICDDAVKFVEREVRRGNLYHGIFLDPPKFGRGPEGEIWNLFDDLPYLIDLTRQLLAPDADFMILTAYSIRASFLSTHELMADLVGHRPGVLASGELVIRETSPDERAGRLLSTSMFSRWSRT